MNWTISCFIPFLILFCCPFLLKGQQEVTFSQYMFNHQSLNPAYAGSKDYTQFVMLHRTQWMNFPGAPESQAFTFNHKMTSKNFGFGLSGINDKDGFMNIVLSGTPGVGKTMIAGHLANILHSIGCLEKTT